MKAKTLIVLSILASLSSDIYAIPGCINAANARHKRSHISPKEDVIINQSVLKTASKDAELDQVVAKNKAIIAAHYEGVTKTLEKPVSYIQSFFQLFGRSTDKETALRNTIPTLLQNAPDFLNDLRGRDSQYEFATDLVEGKNSTFKKLFSKSYDEQLNALTKTVLEFTKNPVVVIDAQRIAPVVIKSITIQKKNPVAAQVSKATDSKKEKVATLAKTMAMAPKSQKVAASAASAA